MPATTHRLDSDPVAHATPVERRRSFTGNTGTGDSAGTGGTGPAPPVGSSSTGVGT